MKVPPEWRFEELPAALVEQEPTQRDQFNNDEVGLAEAVVREAIQNSTDAPSGVGPVQVRFAILQLAEAETARLRGHFKGLPAHLRACNVDDAPLADRKCKLLLIEDFHTKGLTGAVDALDDDNFRNFWRRHGKSTKGGKAGGRWGLGKLVYSSASKVHAFFGLTIRDADQTPYLMGQAVLLNHTVDRVRHPAHGFWFGERSVEGLQIPVSDREITQEFSKLVGFHRTTEAGLSLAVPCALEGLTEDALLVGVVRNYYFPILAGRLQVTIGDTVLDSSTFLTVAEEHNEAGVPYDFVEEISNKLTAPPTVGVSTAVDKAGLSEGHFTKEQLDDLRAIYARGEIVHLKAPIPLRRKNGSAYTSSVQLFLKKPALPGQSFALFARGSLTVPSERRYFQGIPAFGALVATDDKLVEFLGDAENPAHTSWNGNAEKVTAGWENPYETLRSIRACLRSLYNLIGEQTDQRDPDALIDFFSLADEGAGKGAEDRKSRKKTSRKKIVVQPREKAIWIAERKGGFGLRPGPRAKTWAYPKQVRVRTAYDMIGANPFKRFSRFDFDLNRDIALDARNADFEVIAPNVLRVTLQSADFHLDASGFDVNRDLVVEARAVG